MGEAVPLPPCRIFVREMQTHLVRSDAFRLSNANAVCCHEASLRERCVRREALHMLHVKLTALGCCLWVKGFYFVLQAVALRSFD